MRTLKELPTLPQLIAAVEEAGSSQADFFGFPEKPDGLFLQQDPEEYAAFVHYMATKIPPAEISIEIGIASGGQTKFLRDYWSSKKTIVVDIGEHSVFPEWHRIKRHVNSEIIAEIIDDSHKKSVRDQLMPFAGKIDFAFVDGDHSYKGLRKDIFLTKELLKIGGYMALHDTTAAGDVKRVYDELLFSKDFVLVRNFSNRFGISIWKMVRLKRSPTAFNRLTGLGKI